MNNNITEGQLTEVKDLHKKCPEFSSGKTHIAVIVKTYYTARKFHFGVQYWTEKEIKAGNRTTDLSRPGNALYIENLYK